MKIAIILCTIFIGLLCAGCTVTESSTEDVGRQFQEGIQGRGAIVPNNPTNDSFGPYYN